MTLKKKKKKLLKINVTNSVYICLLKWDGLFNTSIFLKRFLSLSKYRSGRTRTPWINTPKLRNFLKISISIMVRGQHVFFNVLYYVSLNNNLNTHVVFQTALLMHIFFIILCSTWSLKYNEINFYIFQKKSRSRFIVT